MDLVAPLINGFSDAPNGTATFVLRGTATATTVYSEFEGTTANATGVVNLDSDGRVEVYVAQVVDCTVRDSDGTTVATFTCGHKAKNVEYIGASFTGTGYSGSPTATSQPTTVADALDKWFTSAAAPDFQVSVNGAATDLDDALSTPLNLVNVKAPAFGAIGDGVGDDSSAIQAAVTYANTNGYAGIFFPSGTYLVVTGITAVTNVVGGDAATVTTVSAINLFTFDSVTNNYQHNVSGLTIAHTGSSGAIFAGSDAVKVSNCYIYFSNGSSLSGTSTPISLHHSYLLILSGSQVTTSTLTMRDCLVGTQQTSGAQFTTSSTNANYNVSGCVFGDQASSSSTWFSFTGALGSGAHISFMDNAFPGAGSATVTALSFGSAINGADIREANNQFGPTVTPYSFTVTSSAGTSMQSRVARTYSLSDNSATINVPAKQYGTFFLTRSDATALSLVMDHADGLSHDGAEMTVILHNSATTTAVTLSGCVTDASGSPHFTLGSGDYRALRFKMVGTTWYMTSTVTGDMSAV